MTQYTQSAQVSQVDVASDNRINALLSEGPPFDTDDFYPVKWGGPTGTSVTVSYSFPAANALWSQDLFAYVNGDVPGFQDAPFEGFQALTVMQQARVVAALNAWSSVANISFQNVAETAGGDVGDIRFGASADLLGNFLKGGYIPFDSNYTNSELAGDIWLATDFESWGTEALRVWQTLDAIGGAIGLVAPGTYSFVNGNFVLPADQDNVAYSLMAHDEDAQHRPVLDYPLAPAGPMLYDIMALQYLYGPNTTFATGNDIYDVPASGTIECIWDAGGSDVITAAAANGASVINLVAGTFSRLGTTPAWQGGLANNLSIAFNVTIEHAVGSDFADTISGNAVANWLIGGDGADIIGAGDQADVVFGDLVGNTVAGGNDFLAGGSGGDYISGGAGDDLLYGEGDGDWIDAGSGGDLVYGGDGGDFIDGGDTPDILYGGAAGDAVIGAAGDDVLYGGDGNAAGDDWMWGDDFDGTLASNDYMYGGTGGDVMFGGGGTDIVYGGADNDYIDSQSGDDQVLGEGGNDLVVLGTGDDLAYGGDGNDALGGAEGRDTLYGGAGDDALWGGAGDDVLSGGAGGDSVFGDTGNDTLIVTAADGWDLFADWNDGDLIDISAFGIAGFGSLTFEALAGGIVHVSGPGGFNLNVALDAGESLDAGDFRFS
jgi:serralysin